MLPSTLHITCHTAAANNIPLLLHRPPSEPPTQESQFQPCASENQAEQEEEEEEEEEEIPAWVLAMSTSLTEQRATNEHQVDDNAITEESFEDSCGDARDTQYDVQLPSGISCCARSQYIMRRNSCKGFYCFLIQVR